MKPAKATDQTPVRSSTATTAVHTGASTRKPWRKKSPVDVVLDQINRLQDDVTAKEEELKLARRQLQKLEEVRKVLEAT